MLIDPHIWLTYFRACSLSVNTSHFSLLIHAYHFKIQLQTLSCGKQVLINPFLFFCSRFHTTAAAAAAKSLQSCPTLCDSIDGSPPGLPCPWDSPGKNTGVGCHFLLQCIKVKSESEVAQPCPTPSNPMDHSPPGSSVHGIFQARVLEWGAIAFSARKV